MTDEWYDFREARIRFHEWRYKTLMRLEDAVRARVKLPGLIKKFRSRRVNPEIRERIRLMIAKLRRCLMDDDLPARIGFKGVVTDFGESWNSIGKAAKALECWPTNIIQAIKRGYRVKGRRLRYDDGKFAPIPDVTRRRNCPLITSDGVAVANVTMIVPVPKGHPDYKKEIKRACENIRLRRPYRGVLYMRAEGLRAA